MLGVITRHSRTKNYLFLTVIGFLLFFPVITHADSLDNWHLRNPLPLSQNPLTSITYANNTYVGVGNNGTIITSSDGNQWQLRTSGIFPSLNSVIYTSNTFVAVGDSGTILTSPDGITWTKQTSGTTNSLRGVANGNNTFVAVGDYRTILTSPDGITWTLRITVETHGLYGITYGNGMFVAVGWDTILTSPDGITWTLRITEVTDGLYGITYGNGTFVAVGGNGTDIFGNTSNVLTSPDGITWTIIDPEPMEQKIGVSLSGIIYANNTFVAVGNGQFGDYHHITLGFSILTSSDCASWNVKFSGNGVLNNIAYANNAFIAVGSVMLTSGDGAGWTEGTIGNANTLNAVTYGNNKYVTVGNGGTIFTSSDGIDWEPRASGTTNNLSAVAYGNDTFVAVGGTILTSSNGITWTERSSYTSNNILDITYGANIFVAVGSGGTILTSPDGITWTIRASGVVYPIYSIVYSEDSFLAVGWNWNDTFSKTNLTSPDGITWTIMPCSCRASFLPVTLKDIAYGNNIFIGVGPYCGISFFQVSSDGMEWQLTEGMGDAGDPYKVSNEAYVAYGNHTFVVIQSQMDVYTTYHGRQEVIKASILTTTDGITWREVYRPSKFLRAATYANNTFIAVGDYGAILQSDPFTVYSISGAVKDMSNSRVLANVLVSVKDASSGAVVTTAYTDGSGNYTAYMLSPGEYIVSATRAGYEEYTQLDSPYVLTDASPNGISHISLFPSDGDTMALGPGWNFISFPKLPSNKSPATVFSDISPNVRIVWGYDNQGKGWKKYSFKTQNSALNTLDSVEADSGYWVYMDASGTITMKGWNFPSSSTVHLFEGWNLIGYSGADTTSTFNELKPLSGKWSFLWSWKNSQWYARQASLASLPVPDLFVFTYSSAYWIKINKGMAADWVQ